MNILDQTQFRPCSSCQVCGAICPVQAITFALNEDGFIRPSIDSSLCLNCGLCKKVCVKYDEEIQLTDLNKIANYHLYSAYSNDDFVRSSSTSGGIAEVISHQLMREGYRIIGVAYNQETNNACHIIAKSYDELVKFRGSKYIQPYSLPAFRELVASCGNQKFAVFGLPCQIYAISRYLERIKKRDQCILIDLYCHGCPSMLVWQKVSKEIRFKTGLEKFENVLWRSKIRGWGRFVLEVQSGGKSVYHSTPIDNAFYDLFFSNQVLNDGCNSCEIRSTLEYTDIRLGDYWGPLYRMNRKGVSGISIVTARGYGVFNRIMNRLSVKEMTYDTFLPYQSWGHKYDVDFELRKRLFTSLHNDSLSSHDAVSLLPSHRSLGRTLKRIVKHLLFLLPR